jgi:hypothetical protein
MRSGIRGSALTESMAAVTIAALVSGGWATALAQQSRTLAAVRDRSEALTIARNLLVHAASGGCAPAPACPHGQSCRTTRTPLHTELQTSPRLVRLEVAVSSLQDEVATIRLATFAYAGGTCG